LLPHRNGIAAVIKRDLRVEGISCVVGLNQFGGAPTGAIKTVGPNVGTATIVLVPHRDGIAAAIKRDLRASGTASVGLNQFGGAPAGAIERELRRILRLNSMNESLV